MNKLIESINQINLSFITVLYRTAVQYTVERDDNINNDNSNTVQTSAIVIVIVIVIVIDSSTHYYVCP